MQVIVDLFAAQMVRERRSSTIQSIIHQHIASFDDPYTLQTDLFVIFQGMQPTEIMISSRSLNSPPNTTQMLLPLFLCNSIFLLSPNLHPPQLLPDTHLSQYLLHLSS